MLRRTAVAIGFTLMVTACASPNTEGSTLNLKDWAEQHGFELRKDIAQGPGGFKGKPNPLPMSASAIAGVEVEIGTDSVCDGIL
ncbi:MAG TPA: hypothetical protein VFT59_01545, partial [Candidatus Saccharimonadales bacterium]|nr:hypothetical protein [Candidatus Saccharimonadales bacterium]